MVRRTAILVLVPMWLAACAGATETDLLGAAPPSSPEATTTRDGTEPLPPKGTTSTSTSEPAAAEASSGSSTPDVPSPSPSPSSSSGASPNPSSSSGSEPSQPWVSAGIACGAATCAPGSSFCCDRNGSASCATTGGLLACVGGTEVRCDDTTDCPNGQVCCASQDALGFATVQCQTQCKSTRLCDPNAPIDACAEIGKSCKAAPGFDGRPSCS